MGEPFSSAGLASRVRIAPSLREHVNRLAESPEPIAPRLREAAETLARWIARNHRPGAALDVIVVCTGNSRRSILGSSMGNLAAAWLGLPEVHFHSGGTEPTAFHPRTVSALRAIGFVVEPTGVEISPGNPSYKVSWGDGFETLEFSKHYSDPSNPREGFAALMVCDEADAGCPIVPGAAVRVAMPFEDPKVFDGEARESAKYAERRDEIGGVMLSVMDRALKLMTKEGC